MCSFATYFVQEDFVCQARPTLGWVSHQPPNRAKRHHNMASQDGDPAPTKPKAMPPPPPRFSDPSPGSIDKLGGTPCRHVHAACGVHMPSPLPPMLSVRRALRHAPSHDTGLLLARLVFFSSSNLIRTMHELKISITIPSHWTPSPHFLGAILPGLSCSPPRPPVPHTHTSSRHQPCHPPMPPPLLL